MRGLCARLVVPAMLGLTASAGADDWLIRMTVDNQYDLYFGNSMMTTTYVGGDTWWPTMETYTVLGRAPTDYLYVTTASDRSVAQGFLGSFRNLTTLTTVLTGDVAWEVFRAGDHLMPIFGMGGAWPANLLPTAAQTDAAIAYATVNGLWTPAVSAPGYTNPGLGPWGAFPLIDPSAQWVWAPSASGGNPLVPGANHGEFLIFRIVGVAPSPGAAATLGFAALFAARRRRAGV